MHRVSTSFVPSLVPSLVPSVLSRRLAVSPSRRFPPRCSYSSSDAGGLPRVNRSNDSVPPAAPKPKPTSASASAYSSPSAADPTTDESRLSAVFQTLSKATLIGRTGADAQIKHIGPTSRCATLRVATNYITRLQHADSSSVATQWHYVQVYDSAPGFDVIAAIPKGTQVYVEGDLRISVSERDGVSRQFTNVIVSKSQGMVRILRRPYTGSAGSGSQPEQPDSGLPF